MLNEYTDKKFTDSPVESLNQHNDENVFSKKLLSNTVIVDNNDRFSSQQYADNKMARILKSTPDPSLVEPVDLAQSLDNDTLANPRIIFSDAKQNDGATNEYADQQSQGTRNTSSGGKAARSGAGTVLDLRIDLSSILQQRERDQRGKQIYRISRSNSKSPATVSGMKASVTKQSKPSKALTKLNMIKKSKESSSDNDKLQPGADKPNQYNLNNVAKHNIKEKSFNELREKIANGYGNTDKIEKVRDDILQEMDKSKSETKVKRRTKMEREKVTKNINSITQVNLSPQRNNMNSIKGS